MGVAGVLLALVLTQGVLVKSGASTNLATVTTKKALLAMPNGNSSYRSYIVSSAAMAMTASATFVIEPDPGQTLYVTKFCTSFTATTTTTIYTVELWRYFLRGTAGTLCAAEKTTSCGISSMDPADPPFSGSVRLNGSSGGGVTVLVGAWQVITGELSVASGDWPSVQMFCYEQPIGALAPSINGADSSFFFRSAPASGTGAVSAGSWSIFFTTVQDPVEP